MDRIDEKEQIDFMYERLTTRQKHILANKLLKRDGICATKLKPLLPKSILHWVA